MTHRAIMLYLLLALANFSPFAHADDTLWTVVAESNTARFSARNGSFHVTTNKATGDVVLGFLRYENKQEDIIHVRLAWIAVKSCHEVAGVVHLVDLDSAEELARIQFFDGDGTIGTSIANYLCSFAK